MNRFAKSSTRLLAALSFCSLSTLAATAAESSDGQGSGNALEEILVTATKRGEQALQDIPLSIQALSGEMLDKANVRDLSDLMTLVPGASEELSGDIGNRRYQIRGVAQGFGHPTVGYYVDDSAFFLANLASAPIGRSFDMQRVEVLRGPQSTLYGNGSMGGTVRYVTNAPNLDAFEAHARTAYSGADGGDPGYYVDGAVSVPLVDNRLAARFVGSFERIGGYREDVLGNQNVDDGEVSAARASLLWQPTQDLRFKLLYLHSAANQDGGSLMASLDPPITLSRPGDFNDTKYDLYAGTLEYDFSFATLTSTTTWIDYRNSTMLSIPIDFVAPGLVLEFAGRAERSGLNNETRLVSRNDGPFQWLAGVFYTDSDSTTRSQSSVPAILPSRTVVEKAESISVFGEVSWELMDGRLIPLFGLRYFEDENEPASTGLALKPTTFHSVNPRFNLSWLPAEHSNYYLNIAKGFRSGSLNNPAVCALHVGLGGLPCQIAVDSDELWSYEVGAKRAIADGQAAVDVALYYEDWRDIRQGVPVAGLYQEYQIGDARIYGIDVGLNYSPAAVDGLTLQLTANWNNAEFVRIIPAIAAASGAREGDRLPFTPEWTAAVSASYGWSIGNDWMGLAFVGLSHIAPQPGQFGQPSVGDARDLLRARFGIRTDRFGVYAFGNNLLGEDGAIYSQAVVGGVTNFTQDYPRQVGIEFSYDY